MRERPPVSTRKYTAEFDILDLNLSKYIESSEVPASLRLALDKLQARTDLNKDQIRQLAIFSLWIHGGNFTRFYSRLGVDVRYQVSNSISQVLADNFLDSLVLEIGDEADAFRRLNRVNVVRRNKFRWTQRQDALLRGELEPAREQKEKVEAFAEVANIVERFDQFGVTNPNQIAAFLGKRPGYIRYVRHRLIRSGRIKPIQRSSNFEQKHAEEKRLQEEIFEYLKKGFDNSQIAEMVKCHVATVRRHRRRFYELTSKVA